MKYIIYCKSNGMVFRELDQYVVEDDGTIFGGINGVNTLRYPAKIRPAILPIEDEAFAALDSNLSNYVVRNGELVKVVTPEE